MVTPTKHVIPGLDLNCPGPLHLGDFCNIFLPNISDDQKKSYRLSTVPYGKYGAGYYNTFIKSLNCLGPLHLGDFCNIFLPNISEDQKKSDRLSTVPYGKYGAGYYIRFIKSLDEGLRQQLSGRKP